MNVTAPFHLTFCNVDDDLLRVWGIADRERYEYIENILEMSKDRLVEGMGRPKSITELAPGSLVLVKQGQQFKRGSIIRQDPGTKSFRIRLLDVGTSCTILVDDIRTMSAIPHLRAIDEAPCALDYILGDALVKPNVWSSEDVQKANHALRVHNEVKVVGTVAGKTLISWSVLESTTIMPFCTLLVQRDLAVYASMDTVKAAVIRKFAPFSHLTTVPPPRMPHMLVRHPYAPPDMMPPPMVSPPMRPPPGLGVYPRPPPPRIAPQPAIRAQQFKVDTLLVGSHHEVHVSHVIEGAQSFMIQLKKNIDSGKLQALMVQINDDNIHHEPVDQCFVGLMCLGRYSGDRSFCRAVVSMILTDGANLLFVDFGNTENVPFNEIYKLPPQCLEEPIMALQFTLAGLSNNPALLTQEARQIFEDLALGAESLSLYVTKPEIQLKQYCELYIKDSKGAKVNIKQKVLDKVKLMKPAEYKKLSFKQNSSNDVIVSYVESPTRFFVQLEVNQPLLDTLMASVEEYCVTSAMKDFLYVEDVNENMAVCCQYSGDNKWYRGLIAEEPLDDGNVVVFYVDYGNQDTVHFSELRIMNNEMISKLPMQAVECRLNIDADFALREEVIEAFVELVDMNSYKMKVINVLPANALLVDLFDEEDRNVKDLLMSMFIEEEPISPLADNAPNLAASQGSGNWRERKTSSNDGDFSAFRREDQQQRSRGKSDSDDRGRCNSDYKRQDSRGVDETDDSARFSNKEHSSSDRWPQDRSDKRSPRDEWSPKSNDRDDRYGGKPRDDGGNRRFDRDGEGRWNNRDGERKPYRRHDDGDSRGGGSRGDDNGERKPYRKRDDSGSRSSRDGDYKKSYSRDDRRGGGGGGYRKNDDDWNRGKSDRNGEKCADDWSGGGKKSDSSWGGKRNDSDFGGRNNNSDWNSKKNDDWGNKKNDDWSSKKNDDWSNKKTDSWSNKKTDDWSNKKTDDWSNKKTDDWGSKKNDSDDWGSKKNDSEWKGKSSFDRDDRRPRRDNDFKPRDGGFSSRDGNRQRGGGYGAQIDSFKSTPALSDGYPAGSQIAENDFQVGQQIAVEISWFLNPVHFFLIPAGNADFRQLMETVQPDYPQRKNPELNSLSPGDFVAARAKDDVIYRAKVIQTRPGGATVTFVDYGNSESVSRNQIWTIGSDHCSQPMQAVCCGLHNISSTGEGGQWSLPDDGEKYFGKEKYTVTFVECREEASSKTWFVNLADENNQDIADLLVADGLAVKNTVLKSEELYDIELLRDQILTVFSSHIESSKKFFVHIEPAKAEIIQQINATLVEMPDSLVPLPTEKTCEGEFCLAIADDEVYCRAQILSVNEAEKVAHVVYIDYGDEKDVTFDAIKTLPEYLMIYNPQIVECCLHDAESFTNEEAFLESLKVTDLMIKVMDVTDNKLSVYVYDINGARLPYPIEVEENVDVLCSLPMLKACEQVFITHITTDKVYLSRTSDTAFITDLCEQLMKHYDAEEPSKVPLEPTVVYAVKSKIFESWYRSILPSADSQEVYYIDYGNTEPVEDLLAVKPLDKSFFVSPTYCVAASTSIKFTCTELTPLIDLVAPVIFKAKFEKQPDGWYVDLKCEKTGKTLADFATECECSFEPIESKTDADKRPYVAFNEWQLNEEKNVSVAQVVSPNSFYLHLTSDVEKIEAMQRSLQRAVHKSLPVVGPVDGLFAAKKSDGQWCRAAVSDQQTVFAVDFGETLSSSVTKKLPLSFAEDQSNYIVECSLNVNPIEDSWSDASLSRFRELVGSGKEIVAKLEFEKSPKLIDLIVDSVSVGSTLVNENLAQWKCHEVIVSHVNSLADFYIQEPELLNDLYELAEKLKEADSWESVEPTVDDLVVAQYDEDQQWYRAVIVKIEEDVNYVRFIDYGNESPCSQFRVLPDSLKSIPYFSSKCSLHTIPENVDDVDEKFVNLVSSADGSFTAYFLNRVEPMVVMLYYNNTAIEDVLQEKAGEVVDLRTDAVPTESVVFDNVAVCHINSPSSFYVQSETAPFDSVATALIEIENAPVAEPAVGNVVAALFPDDGVWYRAKICDMTDGISVLFIDFGNSCIVEELRQLPENAQIVPALAKHCAFTLPVGLDQWPDIAKQRFAELTCEGNTIFKLNLLEEGDPACVDLQDEGVNVADELATLCKADLTATTLLSRATESAVLLSHVESLNELWIQFQSPQLDEMADEMANAETFEAIDTADEGLLVAALFNDDGTWYRAKVTKVVDGVYEVLFIDYGNRSSTSSIKSLPADLVNLPALAKCCQLKDFVEVAVSHVDTVVAKLKEMADAAQSFIVRELVEIDGVNYVTLGYENDKDLTTEICTFYSALVPSDAPVSSQHEDIIKETQEIKTDKPVQDVDVTENAESVNVESEGVTDSEKVVETTPDISEQITNSSYPELVAHDKAEVTEEIVKKDEQVANSVESKVELVPPENAEKEPAIRENGDKEPVPRQNSEKEPVSGQNAEEELICQKAEKVPDKIHEVNSVTSTDDPLEVTETPSETAIAENIILFEVVKPSDVESEPTAGEGLSRSDDVEKVEEPVPEKSLVDSLVTENRCLVVCVKDAEARATTPLLSRDDDGEMFDTSGTASDQTPDFKTPLSKFDAEDSFVTETNLTDDDSDPDHFESAVGPADTASPSSTPVDRVNEAELVDLRMESHDDDVLLSSCLKNRSVVEYTIVGMTPQEFPEKHNNYKSSDSTPDVDSFIAETNLTVEDLDPDHFELAVGPADTASPSAPVDPVNEAELVDLSMESHDDDVLPSSCLKNRSIVEYTIVGITPKEFPEKHYNYKSSDLTPDVDQGEDESATLSVPPLAESEEFDSWESFDLATRAGQDMAPPDAHVSPKPKYTQFITPFVPEALQFADADETSADHLAHLLSGMTINDKPHVTSAPSKIESQDETPPPTVDPVEVHDLIDLRFGEDNTAKSKFDPQSEEKSHEVSHNPLVDLETKLSSSDTKNETRTCNVEFEMAVADQLSQAELMESAKPSESDESTPIFARLEKDCDEPAESSTVDDTSLKIESSEVVKEPSGDVAQSYTETSDASGIPNDNPVSLKVESEMESDSMITDAASAKQSDSPSCEGNLLAEKSVTNSALDESVAAVVKDDRKTTECEDTFSMTASEEATFTKTSLEKASVSLSAADIANKLFSHLVASANDKEKVVCKKSDKSVAAFVREDKKTSECEDTFSEIVPEASDSLIATDVAKEFFRQLVASADDEFNSTSNPFLSAEDTLGLISSSSSSNSESDDTYTDSTSATHSNMAQPQTSANADARVGIVQSHPVLEDDISLAASVVQSLTSIKGNSPADRDVAESSSPVEEESTSPSPTTRDEDAPSLALIADVSPSFRDDAQLPPTVRDISVARSESAQSSPAVQDVFQSSLKGGASVPSFEYIPSQRMPIRPELSRPTASSESTSPENNSSTTTSVTNAAETAPALLAEGAVDVGSEFAKPPEDENGESLPSSGAAEVAHTLANVCQRDDSNEERHGPRPPRIATNSAVAASKQSPTSTDLPESTTPAHEQDDNSSVYFDSCVEQRSVEHSDDEQQPQSFTSSTSDETSIVSGGDANETVADLVVVSYVNTPGSFFVQNVASQEKLRNIEKQLDKLKKVEITPSEVHLSKGGDGKTTLYGAEIDDHLYRVSVSEVNCAGESGAKYTVCCIDYGRVYLVRKLFSLSESLQSVDALATECSLQLPCYLEEWPVDVCQEFERLVTTKQAKFQLKCRRLLEGVAIVDLMRGGRSISQRMKTLCEEFNVGKEFDT